MARKVFDEIRTRPLFYIFVLALCGTVAVASLYVDNVCRHDTNNVFENVSGEVLREPWCGREDFVLQAKVGEKKAKILIRGGNLTAEVREKILKNGFCTLCSVTLSKPGSEGNFYAFDYCKYLKSHGVSYCLYAKETDFSENIEGSNGRKIHGIWYYSWKVRESVEKSLKRYFTDASVGWVMSIMTGDTGGLESASKTLLSKSGFSHLVAVSGAHIAFLTKPVEAFVRRSLLKLGKRKTVSLVPVLLLWFIAGGSASITRAAVMYAVFCVGTLMKRRPDTLNSLGVAGLLQIASNPFSVFERGFILSYACTAAITVIVPSFKRKKTAESKLLNAFLPGIAVNVGVLPLTLYMFNGISIIGILLNMFAAEIAGVLCVGGYAVFFLDKIPFLKPLLNALSNALISLTYVFERTVSKTGNVQSRLLRLETPTPSIAFFIVYYSLLACVLLLISGKKIRIPMTIACLTLVLALAGYFCTKIEILFFDVGQGSAALIKTRDGVCGLVDTGTGSVKLSDFLKKEGVDKLDFLVISHGHSDHDGGFYEVTSNFNPDVIFVPENEDDDFCEEIKNNYFGKVISVDEFAEYAIGRFSRMELYEAKLNTSDLNNGSILIRLSGNWGSVLLPGDAETEEQTEIMQRDVDLSADVLCLGHHGSITSGGESFIKAVRPDTAVISVGYRNTYGHPSGVVLERIKEFGVNDEKVYRTDRDGAVRIRLGKNIIGKEFKMIQTKRITLRRIT